MNALAEFLRTNPALGAAAIAGVVAVVVGLLTLTGVLITVWSAFAKMRAELNHSVEQEHRNREHTRTEAEKERELSAKKDRHGRLTEMRRSIYLDAVAGMTAFQMSIGELPLKGGDRKGAPKELQELAVIVQRISVVGELQTVVSVRRLHNAYMRLFSRSVQRSVPLWRLLREQQDTEHRIGQVLARGETYLEAMRQMNIRGVSDGEGFKRLYEQHRLAQDEASHLRNELSGLHQEAVRHQIDYMDFFTSALTTDLIPLQRTLLVSVRAELELESDEALFDEMNSEMLTEMSDMTKELKHFAGRP